MYIVNIFCLNSVIASSDIRGPIQRKRNRAVLLLFVYICNAVGNGIMKGKVRIPLVCLISPHFRDFPKLRPWIFICILRGQ